MKVNVREAMIELKNKMYDYCAEHGEEIQKLTIVMDPTSWKNLRKDPDFFVLVSQDDYDLQIMGMHQRIQATMPQPLGPVENVDPNTVMLEMVADPFCLYIEMVKANNRVVYFDHPGTAKEFL